jgi:ribosomal protein S18 acetylase RimI-like enzyme
MPLIIRRLEPADLESALLVAKEFIESDYDPWYVEEWYDLKKYSQIFFNPKDGFDTFIARFDDVVGFIIGKPVASRIYEIRHHYVLKNYRQQGIAKKLKQHMTWYASDNGYKVIHSAVSKNNEASIRLNTTSSWDMLPIEVGFIFFKRLPLSGNYSEMLK